MPVDNPRKRAAKLFAMRGPIAAGHALRRRLPSSGLTDRTERAEEADLNEELLWRLLVRGTITTKELREQGVKAPAQGIYDLQLAGYVIDRFRAKDAAGQHTIGYRLSTVAQTFSDPGAASECPRGQHLTSLHPPTK